MSGGAGSEPVGAHARVAREGARGEAQPVIVVAATDVTRDYRFGRSLVRALRGVSVSVARGDFLAITGPSGSGKSTLLHLLGGIDLPTSGEVVFLGRGLTGMSVEERAALRLAHLGLVFQRFHLLPMLTAAENVELPLAAARVPRRVRRGRAAAALERVGLANRLRHRPGELSGGERQRVAIARALVNDPALVLADEPTGELDRATSRRVLALLQSLNREGTTIVVATHDMELAADAHRVMEVVDGRAAP